MSDKAREAFESWCRKQKHDAVHDSFLVDLEERFAPTGSLWTAWQAAWNARHESAGWLPISSAPKDGTKILALCVHEADEYSLSDGNLTDYGARAEGLSHVEDGAHVIMWDEAYEVSDGWENPTYNVPAYWVLASDPEVAANPTHWMLIPSTSHGEQCARRPQVDLTDEELAVLAETIGERVDGKKDFENWGHGFRRDAEGRFTIPLVPHIAARFARAAIAADRAKNGRGG